MTADLGCAPLDMDADVDDAEYARIMRRITIGDGDGDGEGTDTAVSAFNSSI